LGLGCAKTKSDLVVMPSGRQIFAFFALRMTTEPKISGAVIPRRVFTQPGSWSCDPERRVGSSISLLHLGASQFVQAQRTLSVTSFLKASGSPCR
jgi:hypothetical protein